MRARLDALPALVGNTPMVVIGCRFRGRRHDVHAKLESANFTGSIKDRMALRILEEAHAAGQFRPGTLLVEASSGNTGIAFATFGRLLGCDVRIYMPDWMSQERVRLIESLGATVLTLSAAEGGFRGCIERAEAMADGRDDVFLPRQFESDANVRAHHDTTGPEILSQMRALGREPTAFVAGVGTGGTVMGVGTFLKKALFAVAVHPLEPADSPTLRMGRKIGKHRIQGISDEFVPPIVDLSALDPVVDIRDGDAIRMAQQLTRELGLSVGISSGANVLGALKIADEQGENSQVATVLPDDNAKYLSTDLLREEPVREGDLTPEVELLDLRVVPGPCLHVPGREGCAMGGRWSLRHLAQGPPALA